jgi:hypothetical protein
MHIHEFAVVRKNPNHGQQALYALRSFKQGEVICYFTAGEVLDHPTYLTVQIDDDRHITLLPVNLQYTNHSCDPNIFFDTTRMEVVCLKPIAEGEEFTFFYPSTEWKMAQPFECHCGSPNCLGLIGGASDMPRDVLSRYRLTDFIQIKLKLG